MSRFFGGLIFTYVYQVSKTKWGLLGCDQCLYECLFLNSHHNVPAPFHKHIF
jgi:hypothetical protein